MLFLFVLYIVNNKKGRGFIMKKRLMAILLAAVLAAIVLLSLIPEA